MSDRSTILRTTLTALAAGTLTLSLVSESFAQRGFGMGGMSMGRGFGGNAMRAPGMGQSYPGGDGQCRHKADTLGPMRRCFSRQQGIRTWRPMALRQSYAQTFDAPSTPTTLAITIPVLLDSAPAAAVPAPAPTPVVAPAPAPSPAPAAGHSSTGLIVSGIATGLFAVGSGVTAVLYSSKRGDFNKANDAGQSDAKDMRDSAQTLGTANLVLTGGALVSAGFLIYFVATSGSHESAPVAAARSRFNVVPLLSPNQAGLVLRGAL